MANDHSEQKAVEIDSELSRPIEESPSPEFICRNGELVDANEAMVELLGAETRNELSGKRLGDIVDDATLVSVDTGEAGASSVRRDGSRSRTNDWRETRVRSFDGEVRHVRVTSRRVLYRGEPASHVVCHDVTEYRETQETLRQANERLRSVFESTPYGMLVVDPETDAVREANTRATELLGFSREELLSAVSPSVDLPAEDREAYQQCLDTAWEQDSGATGEFTLHDKDGSRISVELSAVPVTFGDARYVLVTIRDVTGRKRWEDSLAKLRERTRGLMQADDRQTVATTTVETVRTVLGFPLGGVWLYDNSADTLRPSAVSEERVDLLGEPSSYSRGEGTLWEAFETGDMLLYEEGDVNSGPVAEESSIGSRLVLPLGEYGVMTVESRETGGFDEADRSLARILATNTETALERADREQRLRVQQRRLQRQNDRLTEFASMIAHDLRNPLNVATAQLAVAREEDDPAFLDDVEQALGRMEEIIDDVLTMARQGETVEETETVTLSTLAEQCWQNVSTDEATIRFEDAPTLQADPTRLQHLLENLFRNAVEHAGPDVTITLGGIEDGFFIEDDGPGIPEADREVVFDPGFSTSEDGTGFGLKIVQEMAAAHGWDVAVTEGRYGGARFEFTGGSE